jgi:hypothetical protein
MTLAQINQLRVNQNAKRLVRLLLNVSLPLTIAERAKAERQAYIAAENELWNNTSMGPVES